MQMAAVIFSHIAQLIISGGFNANKQNRQATDVVATVTIDFSNQQDLWEGFEKKYNNGEYSEWTFSENYTATLRW